MNAYLHIPFCSSFCSYCDFVSFSGREDLLDAYAKAIGLEIASSDLKGPLRTVYFGGGTPSKMEPARVKGLLEALRAKAGLEAGAEITLEANPDSVDLSRLREYRRAGVTRLSLGAQTHFGTLLNLMARRHDWAQVQAAASAAREAGFSDLSLDLMIGLPGQTVAMVAETMGEAISLEPDHLSVYALQLEEGTPLARMVKEGLVLPDEDATADQYEKVQDVMGAAGYEQYEVSNYARPGHACRHNLAVWRGEDYWGFGTAAAGTQGLVRTTNTENLEEYLDLVGRGASPRIEREEIPPRVREFEKLMLMLRTRQGVPETQVVDYLKGSPVAARDRFESFLREGWLVREGGRIHPAPAGFLKLNGMLETLLV